MHLGYLTFLVLPSEPKFTMPKFTSTLHRVASAILSDRTFDVSPMAPLANDSKDAATIAAEVSAAAAVQASKEFCRMREPKIMKLKGGYSADAELMFRSVEVRYSGTHH